MRTWLIAMSSVVSCSSAVTGDGGAIDCDPAESRCGRRCSNLRIDDENCGSCGVACVAENACAGGECFPRECPTVDCTSTYACVQDRCAERVCVGVLCPAGERCFEGVCRSAACGAITCPSGTVCDRGRCLDLSCAGVLCPQGSHCELGTCATDSPCLAGADGIPCGADLVCRAGACVVCVSGGPCVPAASCRMGRLDCATGTPACVDIGPAADGTPCAQGSCSSGACAGCDAGSCDGGTPAPATLTFVSSAATSSNQTTYSFLAQDIGAATPNRIVVVCAHLGGGALTAISAISVNGTPLSLTGLVHDATNGGSLAIGYKAIPSGTTGTITVTSGGAGRAAIAVFNLAASNETPIDSRTFADGLANTSSISVNISAQAGGVVIANVGHGSSNPSWTWSGTWTGHSEHLDATWVGEQGSHATASAATSSGGVRSIAATPSQASRKLLSVGAWR